MLRIKSFSAAGSIDRTFVSRRYETEAIPHRMCAEFGDFARIIDERDKEEAGKLLDQSLIVMEVLETARKSAGIRFGCDA